MRVVLQRVKSASVRVDDEPIGSIGPGLLLLVGVTDSDSTAEIEYLVGKIANLRIFHDDAGKMNRSLIDVGQDLLVVSQFTLFGDVRKGRRPSFVHAATPEMAKTTIEDMINGFRQLGLHVESGRFGAEMAVELINDGPVTIWLDTDELMRRTT